MSDKKYRKIFKRIPKCTFCKMRASDVLEIGKKYICYDCVQKAAKLFHLTISTLNELFQILNIFDPALIEEINKIISSNNSEIDIKKLLKEKYNINITFF
jgi:hypothetical protein